jgi:hypothetical protein
MTAAPVELARLESWGTGFGVRITGRDGPGVPSTHDLLVAEIVVWSEFVSGSLRQVLHPRDLDAWSAVIDGLESGEDSSWLTESGRTAEVRFDCDELDRGLLTVRVDEPNGARAAGEVVVDVGDGWIDDLRLRLAEVRRAFPRETAETSPGVWVWDHGRGS